MDIDTDELIKELYKLVEIDGIKITSINYKGGVSSSVEINGNSGDKSAIQKMWANLRENEKFADSHVNSWSGEGEIKFSVSVKTKGGSANEK